MNSYPSLLIGIFGVVIIAIYAVVAYGADKEWKQYHDGRAARATVAGAALFLFALLGLTGTFAIAFPEHTNTIRGIAMLLRGSVFILGLWLLGMRRRPT